MNTLQRKVLTVVQMATGVLIAGNTYLHRSQLGNEISFFYLAAGSHYFIQAKGEKR